MFLRVSRDVVRVFSLPAFFLSTLFPDRISGRDQTLYRVNVIVERGSGSVPRRRRLSPRSLKESR
jgi:hypothetical protein